VELTHTMHRLRGWEHGRCMQASLLPPPPFPPRLSNPLNPLPSHLHSYKPKMGDALMFYDQAGVAKSALCVFGALLALARGMHARVCMCGAFVCS
jgi:hypothetical protein